MTGNKVRGFGILDNFIANLRHNIALKKLKSFDYDQSIIDIGCGMFPYFLAKTNFKQRTGVDCGDFKQKVVDGIKITSLDIANADLLPFEDNQFEVVTMLAVFEHIEPEKLPMICREIHRILKPRGVFFMTTPAPWADGLLRFLAKMKLISSVEIDDHKDAYNIKDVKQRLSNSGFETPKISAGYFEMTLNIWILAVK